MKTKIVPIIIAVTLFGISLLIPPASIAENPSPPQSSSPPSGNTPTVTTTPGNPPSGGETHPPAHGTTSPGPSGGDAKASPLKKIVDDFKKNTLKAFDELSKTLVVFLEIQMPPESRPKSPEALKDYLEMRKKMEEAVKKANEAIKKAKSEIGKVKTKMEQVKKDLDSALLKSDQAIKQGKLEAAAKIKDDVIKLLKKSGATLYQPIYYLTDQVGNLLIKTAETLKEFKELQSFPESMVSLGKSAKIVAKIAKTKGTELIDFAKKSEEAAKDFVDRSRDQVGKPGDDKGKPSISGSDKPGASGTAGIGDPLKPGQKPGDKKPVTKPEDGVQISTRTKAKDDEEGEVGKSSSSGQKPVALSSIPKTEVKNIQRHLNEVAKFQGWTPIKETGVMDAETISRLKHFQSYASPKSKIDSKTIDRELLDKLGKEAAEVAPSNFATEGKKPSKPDPKKTEQERQYAVQVAKATMPGAEGLLTTALRYKPGIGQNVDFANLDDTQKLKSSLDDLKNLLDRRVPPPSMREIEDARKQVEHYKNKLQPMIEKAMKGQQQVVDAGLTVAKPVKWAADATIDTLGNAYPPLKVAYFGLTGAMDRLILYDDWKGAAINGALSAAAAAIPEPDAPGMKEILTVSLKKAFLESSQTTIQKVRDLKASSPEDFKRKMGEIISGQAREIAAKMMVEATLGAKLGEIKMEKEALEVLKRGVEESVKKELAGAAQQLLDAFPQKEK